MSAGQVHPSALVHPRARIAPGVAVGAYSIIGEQVEVGEGSWIGPHVVIEGRTRIGRNNRIYQFASIGAPPQDKKYDGEDTAVEIGDGNTLREYVNINRGTARDAGVTRVGDDNWIMANVHFAHDCQVGSHTIFANYSGLAGHVHVGDWAILGATTLVHQFVSIGAHSFTGMGTYLPQDLPPYVMAAGTWRSPTASTARGCGAAASAPIPSPGSSAHTARSIARGWGWRKPSVNSPRRRRNARRSACCWSSSRAPGAVSSASIVGERATRVAMVAGETSGDQLGAHLIAALQARRPSLHFGGIGGPRMAAQGFEVSVPMDKLAVRGYTEALRHYREIMRIRREVGGKLVTDYKLSRFACYLAAMNGQSLACSRTTRVEERVP